MNENTQPAGSPAPDPKPDGAERRHWIDEDGNVHGVVLTLRVDHFVEFTDQAIGLTPGPQTPDKPTA